MAYAAWRPVYHPAQDDHAATGPHHLAGRYLTSYPSCHGKDRSFDGILLCDDHTPGRIIGIGAFVLLGPDNAPVAAPAVTALQGPDKGLILEALAPGNPFSDAAQGRLLPLIVLTILLGLAFRQIPLDRRLFLSQFNDGLAQGMQVVTGWIIRLAPLGAFALVARYMALYGETLAANILWLMGVIAIAALIHGLVVLPLLAMEPGSVPG